MSAENELTRQKMLVESNAALEKDKLQADLKRDMEFQQVQQKERDRAMAAQQKLRALVTAELEERVQLERALVKQPQQNLLLQKQTKLTAWKSILQKPFSMDIEKPRETGPKSDTGLRGKRDEKRGCDPLA